MSLWRLAKFLIGGGSSLGVDLALQAVLLELARLPVWLGATLSYELALIAYFIVSNWWVFEQRQMSWRRLAEFHAAALTAVLITLGVTNFLVYGPPAPLFAHPLGPYLAKIAGTGLAITWTFAASFFWIWRPSAGHPILRRLPP